MLSTGRLPLRRPFVLLAAVCALAACDRAAVPERPPILELGAVVAELPPGARVHEVRVGGAAPAAELEPDTVRARPGDVVGFTAVAHGMHAVAFDAPALAPEAGAFLSETRQLRGPPLVKAGATWVVSLDGAPPGTYPFVCITHGARGVLVVEP
jgi:plastocyanin